MVITEERHWRKMKTGSRKERDRKKSKKDIRKKEELTKKIALVGLWTTINEVEDGIELLKTKKEKLKV